MNDILLTPDEMADEINAAWGDKDCIVTCDDLEVGDFALCRAQVRKVVEAYDQYLDGPVKGADCPCDACRTRRFVAALREAAGEGKSYVGTIGEFRSHGPMTAEQVNERLDAARQAAEAAGGEGK